VVTAQKHVGRRVARLDLAVGMAVLGLLVAILGVILLGDRVGLTVRRAVPQGTASSQPIIQITFEEDIAPESLAGRVHLDPPVEGELSAIRNVVQFVPATPLQAGQTYTVQVLPGITARWGRQLLAEQSWTFRVRGAQLVYLGPVDNIIQNLYSIDPFTPTATPTPLTDSAQGVISFDVQRDGSRIVYSQLEGQGTASLYLYDGQQTSLLMECPDAACTSPAWRPDGQMIAFERADLNRDTGIGPSVPRIWLLDVANRSVRPLFNDSQRLGYSPRWSPDGNVLAFYDANAGGIVLYDFRTQKDRVITTPQGEVGHFSPDGRYIYFPKIVQLPDGRYAAHFVLVDVTSDLLVQRDLIPDTDPSNDVEVAWRADSKALFVVRRPPDSTTLQGAQLYELEIETGAARALVNEPKYSHGQLQPSPDGKTLAFQRFALGQPGARPEIWMLDLATGELRQIVQNATSPRWMP